MLVSEDENPNTWTVLQVTTSDGDPMMAVERNPVVEGALGAQEIDELIDEISECEPKSAVKWLQKYLPGVKVIYAFRLLSIAFEDANYAIVNCIRTTVWNRTGGILQADNEGFSNENGYHILWQFADDVTGQWQMAVRSWIGGWTDFQMDLGNPDHRAAFKAGKVPAEN